MSEQAISYEELIIEEATQPELHVVPEYHHGLQLRSAITAYIEGEIEEEPLFSVDDPVAIRDVKVALAASSPELIKAKDSKGRSCRVYEPVPAEKAARIRALQLKLMPKLEEIEQVKTGRMHVQRKTNELYATLAEAQRMRATWVGQAACQGLLVDRFYPFKLIWKGRSSNDDYVELREKINELVQPCQNCPVREQCEDYGLKIMDRYASIRIFGGKLFGLSPQQARYLRRGGLETYIAEDKKFG